MEHVPGAGAAGGLGAGLLAFLKGELVSGIELVLNTVNFRAEADTADLVFTGEGKFDAQSPYGKVPIGVARACKPMGVPVVVLAGSVALDIEAVHDEGNGLLCYSQRPHDSSRVMNNCRAVGISSRAGYEIVER